MYGLKNEEEVLTPRWWIHQRYPWGRLFQGWIVLSSE